METKPLTPDDLKEMERGLDAEAKFTSTAGQLIRCIREIRRLRELIHGTADTVEGRAHEHRCMGIHCSACSPMEIAENLREGAVDEAVNPNQSPGGLSAWRAAADDQKENFDQ